MLLLRGAQLPVPQGFPLMMQGSSESEHVGPWKPVVAQLQV
jgi:hypothetical protein